MDAFYDFVKSVSHKRLVDQGAPAEGLILEPTDKQLVYAHWMGLILVGRQGLKTIFKVHFSSNQITGLLGRKFKSKNLMLDFAKEYCNLVAGAIKAELGKAELDCGISLPLITRGFDETFFATIKQNNEKIWKLRNGNDEIYAAVSVQCDTKSMDLLKGIAYSDINEEVDEEFDLL